MPPMQLVHERDTLLARSGITRIVEVDQCDVHMLARDDVEHTRR
jgi:hypothetical protein